MTRPVRIRLSRAKGFNLKAESEAINGLPAVSVARGPGRKWGNPWPVGKEGPFGRAGDAEAAVYFFREMFSDPELAEAAGYPSVAEIRAELRGKNLACFCPLDAPCHADVLLELANPDEGDCAAHNPLASIHLSCMFNL